MAPLGSESMRLRFDRDAAPVNYVYMVYDAEGRACYVGRGRNGRMQESRRKHGERVEIIAADLTSEAAKHLEALLIKILGCACRDRFGILRNRMPGRRINPSTDEIVAWKSEALSWEVVEVGTAKPRGARFALVFSHVATGMQAVVVRSFARYPRTVKYERGHDRALLLEAYKAFELGHDPDPKLLTYHPA